MKTQQQKQDEKRIIELYISVIVLKNDKMLHNQAMEENMLDEIIRLDGEYMNKYNTKSPILLGLYEMMSYYKTL